MYKFLAITAAAVLSISCASFHKQRSLAHQHGDHGSDHDHLLRIENNRATDQTSDFQVPEMNNLSRHSFILVDPKGHFAYHFSQFSNQHQHQMIIKGNFFTPGSDVKKDDATVLQVIGTPVSQAEAKYYSFTTASAPAKTGSAKFPELSFGEAPATGDTKTYGDLALRSLFPDGDDETPKYNLVNHEVDIFRGFIGNGSKLRRSRYHIDRVLYREPLIASNNRINTAAYIAFGFYGPADNPKERTDMYIAHYIDSHTDAQKNYDQILKVTLEENVALKNGSLLIIKDVQDVKPLELNKVYTAKVYTNNEEVGEISFKTEAEIFAKEAAIVPPRNN